MWTLTLNNDTENKILQKFLDAINLTQINDTEKRFELKPIKKISADIELLELSEREIMTQNGSSLINQSKWWLADMVNERNPKSLKKYSTTNFLSNVTFQQVSSPAIITFVRVKDGKLAALWKKNW